MLARIAIHTHDLDEARRFYDLVLATLGVQPATVSQGEVSWGDFALASADAAQPVTRGLHLGFGARARELVDAFWRAGTDAGYRDDGAPGPRPIYTPGYYGGFLLDVDDNSAEACHHEGVRTAGTLDHVWMRVRDLDASRAYYDGVAARSGLRLAAELPDRVRFAADGGPSLSLVAGEPSRNVQLTFAATGAPALEQDPDGNVVELASR